MKKLNKKRAQKLAVMAIALLVMITGLVALVSPTKAALGAPVMALVIGGVTLNDKETALFEGLKAEIQTEAEKHAKGYVSETHLKEAITAALEKYAPNIKDVEDFKSLETALTAQGLELKALKESGGGMKFKSISEQIAEQLELKKDELAAFQRFDPNAKMAINLKVAGSMRISTNVSGANLPVAQVEPGMILPLLAQLKVVDACNVGRSSSQTYQYIQMLNRDGNAAVINDATVAPLVDFDPASATSTAHDAVGATNVHANMINDIEGIQTEIQNNLIYEVKRAKENDVITYLTGTAAGAFVDPGIDVTTPNEYDALIGCIAAIKAVNGTANVAVFNPIDYANIISGKGVDGHYINHPLYAAGGTTFAGLQLIESTLITVGNVLVGDFTKARVLDYMDIEISFGWDGANGFRDRIITILGVERYHIFVASNHTPAFIYDSWTDIKSAILAP